MDGQARRVMLPMEHGRTINCIWSLRTAQITQCYTGMQGTWRWMNRQGHMRRNYRQQRTNKTLKRIVASVRRRLSSTRRQNRP